MIAWSTQRKLSTSSNIITVGPARAAAASMTITTLFYGNTYNLAFLKPIQEKQERVTGKKHTRASNRFRGLWNWSHSRSAAKSAICVAKSVNATGLRGPPPPPLSPPLSPPPPFPAGISLLISSLSASISFMSPPPPPFTPPLISVSNPVIMATPSCDIRKRGNRGRGTNRKKPWRKDALISMKYT